MTHTFDSEVSLHYWLLWPTVCRPTPPQISLSMRHFLYFKITVSFNCGSVEKNNFKKLNKAKELCRYIFPLLGINFGHFQFHT